jgi:4-alpha-glucanotransferase
MQMTERQAGILFHILSLPSEDGIGDFGKNAFDFVDFLSDAGVGIWQILPLGPTAFGDSPYTAVSSFAGNPLFISLEKLREQGLLEASEFLERPDFWLDGVEYPEVNRWKIPLLRKAALRFVEEATEEERKAYGQFCERESWWLEDFALFYIAKHYYDDQALRERAKSSLWNIYWPEGLATRDPKVMAAWREERAVEIETEKVLQFFFAEQWKAVRAYANSRGIRLFGDLPIFVSPESADVWSHPELFKLDKKNRPTVVAGVPPDYFSATGQRWGNPVYRWEAHRKTGFEWWISRLRKTLEQVDILRIDHFRGFEAYWEIPASEKTAIRGTWKKSPGRELFQSVREVLGDLPIVAEDLGVITPEVRKLQARFGIPGMKVLQFAFDPDDEYTTNPFYPHNFSSDCIAYTGTHDNDTTRGWYEKISPETQNLVRSYLGHCGGDIVWDAIRVLYMSVAAWVVIPFQDILSLGSDARMNTPATVGGNWSWRVRQDAFNELISGRLRWFGRLYDRLASRPPGGR